MTSGDSAFDRNLNEIFGRELEMIKAGVFERYVDINEAALQILYGTYNWPANGEGDFLFWAHLDRHSVVLNPPLELVAEHEKALGILLTGLGKNDRKLLARRLIGKPQGATAFSAEKNPYEHLFQWVDPSELVIGNNFKKDGPKRFSWRLDTYDLVLVKKRDLEPFVKLFGGSGSANASHVTTADTESVSHSAGRPRKWDWDAIFCEVVIHANQPDGLPDTQAALVNWVMDKCMELYGNYPSEGQIKKKIKPIYAALRKEAQNSSG